MIEKSLLIIDDDLSIRKSLSNFFEDRGYIIFSAEDGRKGLEIFFDENIDLVITDLRMPEKDGLEVMKTIHREKPEIPMIVVSGAGTEEDIIKALRMGAKDYITKPITDFEFIEHTVKSVLEISQLNKENKAYRKQIEKSEKQYRTITENIAEGVFTVDENLGFTYTNETFSKMVQMPWEEIQTRKLPEFISQNSAEVLQKNLDAPEKQSTFRTEIQIMAKNNRIIHAELSCRLLLDSDGQIQEMIAIARDITNLIILRDKYKKFLTSSPEARDENVVPICANCKDVKIRKGQWIKVEDYFSTVTFSHGICPDCCNQLYPDFDICDPSS